MDDLISRQAAISLPVKPREDRYFQTQSLDDAYDYGWRSLQRCIEKLPSAEPEIIKCRECIHWKHSAVRENYCEVFDWMSKAEDFCSFAERRTDE